MILLSKQFLELGFIEDEEVPAQLVNFVDLCLIYAIYLITDYESYVTLELIDCVIFLLKVAIDRIQLFSGKTDKLELLLDNKLIKKFLEEIDEESVNEDMRFK